MAAAVGPRYAAAPARRRKRRHDGVGHRAALFEALTTCATVDASGDGDVDAETPLSFWLRMVSIATAVLPVVAVADDQLALAAAMGIMASIA